MKTGEVVKTNIGDLTLEEHVPCDPSMYQWEEGWWASDSDGKEFFVSKDGTVYNNSDEWPDRYDLAFGKVLDD